jgi:hypothetical protein
MADTKQPDYSYKDENNLPPVPTHPALPDDDELDDFAEVFIANLNENTRENTTEQGHQSVIS